jgi:hypothetical protein
MNIYDLLYTCNDLGVFTGALVEYLHGNKPIKERLRIMKRCFIVSKKYPNDKHVMVNHMFMLGKICLKEGEYDCRVIWFIYKHLCNNKRFHKGLKLLRRYAVGLLGDGKAAVDAPNEYGKLAIRIYILCPEIDLSGLILKRYHYDYRSLCIASSYIIENNLQELADKILCAAFVLKTTVYNIHDYASSNFIYYMLKLCVHFKLYKQSIHIYIMEALENHFLILLVDYIKNNTMLPRKIYNELDKIRMQGRFMLTLATAKFIEGVDVMDHMPPYGKKYLAAEAHFEAAKSAQYGDI